MFQVDLSKMNYENAIWVTCKSPFPQVEMGFSLTVDKQYVWWAVFFLHNRTLSSVQLPGESSRSIIANIGLSSTCLYDYKNGYSRLVIQSY